MALNGLLCAEVPLTNYSLTHWAQSVKIPFLNSWIQVQISTKSIISSLAHVSPFH